MRNLMLLALALAAGCSAHASVQASTTPPPATDVAPPATEPDAEPPPVVASELKTLEIQKEVIRLKPGMKILFGSDSDKLLPEDNEILDEVVSVLQQNGKLRIRVEGHTDNVGDKGHNEELSTRRAAAVRAYLITKGMPEDRLESVGCGAGTPIADNATEDGKAQNRRVEFVIMHHKHPKPNCQLYTPGEHHHHDDKDAAPAAK